MQANVHMIIGATTATSICLLTQNTDPKVLIPSTVIAIFGAIVSDVDAEEQSKFKNMFEKFIEILILIGMGAWIYMHITQTTFDVIKAYLLQSRILIGILIFTIVCLIGYFTKHRTFTHWLIAIPIFSIGICLIFGFKLTIFFALGLLSHDLIDCLNKREILLFFPIKKNCALYKCESESGTSTAIGFVFWVIFIFEIFYMYQDIIKMCLPF